MVIPIDGSAGDAICARLRNPGSNDRERVAAATHVWRRSRRDTEGDLRWAAATFENLINNQETVCISWLDISDN